jgi:hypothetical protein
MLHISDLHLKPTRQMISEESASYRLQCAAETLDNIKNDLHDLHECVNLNLGRKKPTIRFWDELNPTQTNSVDAVVSGSKSKILEEKLQNEGILGQTRLCELVPAEVPLCWSL